MGEYPAIWINADRPDSLYAGRLVVAEGRLQLDGAGPGGAWTTELRSSEIAGVRPARGRLRVGNRPWVRLDLRTGGTLLIGTVLGAKALPDLLDAIASLLS